MSEREDREKLDALGARLNALHKQEEVKEQSQANRQEASQNAGIGMRIGIELIAAVLAGGGIGFFLDSKLGTKPIFLLAFLVLGFAAGVLDVLRVMKGLDHGVGLGRAMRDKEARDKQASDAQKAPPNAWDDDDD